MALIDYFLSRRLKRKIKVEHFYIISPDNALLCDALGHNVLHKLKEIGGEYQFDFSKVYATCGRNYPPRDVDTANYFKIYSKLVKEFGIRFLGPNEAGVIHNVFAENRIINPGDIIVGTDSHTLTAGAFSALSIGVGHTEMIAILKYGKMWFKVPKTIKVKLYHETKYPVTTRDVVSHLMRLLGPGSAVGKILEIWNFSSSILTVDDKMMITSLTAELGVASTIFAPDDIDNQLEFNENDYEKIIDIDMSDIKEPLVAAPHDPFNIKYLSECTGARIDQCFIGTCSGGGLTGLRQVADILKGKFISSDMTLIVSPQSKQVYSAALEEGIIDILLNAGATITSPTCGACMANHNGVLAEGIHCISTGNRNFKGRMGDPNSSIYLASPAVSALASIHGRITPF